MRIHVRVALAAVIVGCTLSFWATPLRVAIAQSAQPVPTHTVVVIERPMTTEGLSVAVTAYVDVVGSEPGTPAGSVDFFDADDLFATASLEAIQQRTGERFGSPCRQVFIPSSRSTAAIRHSRWKHFHAPSSARSGPAATCAVKNRLCQV